MTIVILSTELMETPASASLIHLELERAYNQTIVIEVGELPQ